MPKILYGDRVLFNGKLGVVKEINGIVVRILLDNTKKTIPVIVDDLEKVNA